MNTKINALAAKVKTDKALAQRVFNFGEQGQDGKVSRQVEDGLFKYACKLDPNITEDDKEELFAALQKAYDKMDYSWIHESVGNLQSVITNIAMGDTTAAETALSECLKSKMKKLVKPKKLKEAAELNEGYEKVVLNLLSDNGIDGYFEGGKLCLPKSDMQKAKKILADSHEIDQLPEIIFQEVNL